MLRPLLALATCSFLLMLSPARGRACSCMEQTLDDQIASADAIFEARVAAVEPLDPNVGGGALRVRLDVMQRFRGTIEHEHVEVQTAESSAACGFGFEVGQSYLVYASGQPEAMSVGLCSGTKRMEQADEDRARLGSGTIPVDIEDNAPRPRAAAEPGRGGCAGCTIGRGESSLVLAVLGLVLATSIARRRIR